MYILADCNSFYASCEQVFRPDLRGKPVVVLSNNDGCIVARSPEAKRLNIPDLEPYFKLRTLLERHKVAVFSSNYALYAELSSRIMDMLREAAERIEVYSIDEAFLYFSDTVSNLPAYGQQLKADIWQQIRIPISVGAAPTKTLAKLANHIAKTSTKCRGVCVIYAVQDWHAVFKKMPVNTVWGIGRAQTKKLQQVHIHSVYDLMKTNPKQMRRRFNVCVERTIRELNGMPCFGLDEHPEPRKQIICSRSFGRRITKRSSLTQAVSAYATRAAEKLRAQKGLIKTLVVFVESSRFDANPYRRSYVMHCPYPTNDTRVISEYAQRALHYVFLEGVHYAKAGVMLVDIMPDKGVQQDLFVQQQSLRDEQLMTMLDTAKTRGLPLGFARQLPVGDWAMRRDLKSPDYLTRWSDIPVVKA